MAGVAKITLVGHLGRDPETRYTPNGTMNIQFSIAVSRPTRDQSGGQGQERTNWYRVTAWDRLAEQIDNMVQKGYIAKGRLLFVEGNLEAREYQDQSGQTKTSLDVRMTDWAFVGGRQDGEGRGEGGDQGYGGERNYGGGQGQGGGYGGGNRGGGGRTDDANNGPDNYDEVPF